MSEKKNEKKNTRHEVINELINELYELKSTLPLSTRRDSLTKAIRVLKACDVLLGEGE